MTSRTAPMASADEMKASSNPEAPAFDPLKGGCPHCMWLDTNLGRVLDQKCELHQKIEDMQVDLAMQQSISRDTNKLFAAINAALDIDPEDDPVAAIHELREADTEAPAAPVVLEKRPVAFRVKDYADGWAFFLDEEKALAMADEMGALMQGLYARDGAALVAASAVQS